MIYLNHAGTSWPMPEPVRTAVASTMNAPIESWASELDDAHRTVAHHLGLAGTAELLLTPGATSALAIGISDHAWKPGDKILVSGLEHHALHRPAMQLQSRGVEMVVVPGTAAEPIALEAIEQSLRAGGVRLVAVTAASNVTGELLPTAAIAKLAHAHGALCLVDAAQTAGWLPLVPQAQDQKLGRDRADLIAFAGHKGPQAPWGVGGLCIAPGVEMASPRAGSTEVGSEPPSFATAPGFCDVGSVDRVALAGLAAGLQWLAAPERAGYLLGARAQIARLAETLRDLPGVVCRGSATAEDRTPIVAFTSDRTPASALAAQLARNGIAVSGGIQCAPLAHRTLGTLEGGVVRISVGPATTDDEVQEAIDGLRRCLLRDGST